MNYLSNGWATIVEGKRKKAKSGFRLFTFTFYFCLTSGSLPLHGAFLRSVDLRYLWHFAEEVALDVVEKEILRVGI